LTKAVTTPLFELSGGLYIGVETEKTFSVLTGEPVVNSPLNSLAAT